jgi:catechol 2,3-dioxygenase-like lactoylglutathione lyase family enzyme
MSTAEVHNAGRDAAVRKVDMKLEVQIVPVSDVDRSKEFYQRLGWRLDDDAAPLPGLRVVQFTPPGSGASVTFGQGLTGVPALVHRAGLDPLAAGRVDIERHLGS